MKKSIKKQISIFSAANHFGISVSLLQDIADHNLVPFSKDKEGIIFFSPIDLKKLIESWDSTTHTKITKESLKIFIEDGLRCSITDTKNIFKEFFVAAGEELIKTLVEDGYIRSTVIDDEEFFYADELISGINKFISLQTEKEAVHG